MTALFFNHVWQSTLSAGVIAVVAFALRHNRARLRYGLWLAASVKFLVPFAAMAAVGGLVQWQQAPTPIRSILASPAVRDFNAPFAAMWLDPTMTVPAAAQAPWIAPLLVGVWLCGFTAIAFRRVKQWREIRAAVRASTTWDTAAPASAGLEIRTAPTVLEPGVVGLWRPIILLPTGIDSDLTDRQLTAVLAHEICHARRRDNLTAAAHMLVEALFWFHPLVWWIGARLVAEREQACDEHVIAETGEAVAYAAGIVAVCRRYVEAPLMSVAGVGGADVKARIDAILANRIGLSLTLPKRVVLVTTAVVSLIVPLATGAIDAAAVAAGQLPRAAPSGPAVNPETRFEIVSIKPFDPSQEMRISMTPGRYDVAGMPLQLVVAQALGVPVDRLIGLPDWMKTERYTIAAKAPDGAPVNGLTIMVANLLKDRFKLATHHETRELPIYHLVFARNDKRFGPAFKESSAECRATLSARLEAVKRDGPAPLAFPEPDACPSAHINPGIASFRGVQMAVIAQILTQSVGRPVLDKTGLASYYDFDLRWTPQLGSGDVGPFGLPPGAGAQPPPADPDAPNLFTAVQEQLGLKLESARGPVEVIVIDRLEKPTLD
jgi:bla regulator protein blaR1